MIKSINDLVIYGESKAEITEYRSDPEKVVAGDPLQKVESYFEGADGQFLTGIWHSEPGTLKINYTEYEYCMLTKGLVKLTDTNGDSREIKAGDSFVIPSGFQGTWETIEAASKFYVIFEPK